MKVTQKADVVLRVPRYGTVTPPREILDAARKVANNFKPGETIDPHSPEGESVVNASEWNSMLHTARAARGPQWDVSSQLFHVDKESPLYYDFTPLLTGEADGEGGENLPSQGQTPSGHSFNSPPPSFRRTPSHGGAQNDLTLSFNGNPATPSPVPTRSEMPPPSSERRRITRGSSARDAGY